MLQQEKDLTWKSGSLKMQPGLYTERRKLIDNF